MGVVFEAEDLRLKRHIALKFLPPGLTGDPDFKKRFIQEAQAASVLEDQNICTIYEVDETPDGQLYISMAYYAGETLKQAIGRGPLPLGQALDLVTQIARGLVRAHGRKIIHRDIKPSNIMITEGGVVKIVDFGLAKLADLPQITETSRRVGTTFYMSPEQALGEDVDHRTDLWSLGVVFYEALAGKLPFEGENESSVLYAIVHESPLPPSEWRRDIPDEAERIIARCLHKKAAERYASAEQLLADLVRLKRELEDGTSARPSDPAKRPGKSEAERRLATIIFIELAGYRDMLGRLDPEEAAAISDRLFATIRSVFENAGARAEKTSEAGFLALFGVPRSVEDAPRKAVNAAIEIRESVRRFGREESHAESLDVRIGVNTGTVVAGDLDAGGKKELSVYGEAFNLAAELKNRAARGEVLVGPVTHKSTREDFTYEKVKPIAREGGTAPAPVYRLVSVRQQLHRAKIGPERMIHSSMVGREREWDRLRLHVLKVINGEGSIVNVIGDAGIGKSRLIAELGASEEAKRVTLLQGRAIAQGQNLSFHPIIDILKSWARIREEDPPAEAARKIEAEFRGIDPDGAAEAFPFIATMMGLKISGPAAERVRGIEGESLEKLILKSLRELLVKLSERRPLVVVIDDLHWADGTTIEFLLSLVRLAQKHRVLFISVFRPEYEKTGERFARKVRDLHRAYAAEIRLEPLGREDSLALVGNLVSVSGLPPSLQERIIQKTGGNPFFIEEVVRSFIDEGAVEVGESGFRVTDKIDTVTIPETVQEILMARIDRLDEETRALLKVASVIGRNFFYKILAEVARSADGIEGRLTLLKEIQLIQERRRLEELEFLFKHALVQEVVYDSLLLKKRKELHLEVARAIETVFASKLHEFYGVLAYHYSCGESLEKAQEYLVKSGEEALKAAASSEAIFYYQEALKLYLQKQKGSTDPDTVAHLEWNIAKAFLNKGRMAEAVQHFDRVMEIWGERRPKTKAARFVHLAASLLRVIGSLYLRRRRPTKVPTPRMCDIFEIIYNRGTAIVSVDTWRMVTDSLRFVEIIRKYDLSRIPNGVAMYASSSALFFFSGISFRLARKVLDDAASYIDPSDAKTLYKYKFWEAAMDTHSGEWRKERPFDRETLDRNIREGDPYTPPGYAFYSGILASERGRFQDSAAFIRFLQETGDVYENDYARARKHVLLAIDLIKRRKLAEAVREADDGTLALEPIGQVFWTLCLQGIKLKACLLLKDAKGADDALRRCERSVSGEKRVAPFYQSAYQTGRFLSDLIALEGARSAPGGLGTAALLKKARRSGKAAYKNSKKCAFGRIEVLTLMGVHSWLAGKPGKAWAWWQKSVKAGQDLGARPELGRAYAEIGIRSAGSKASAAEFIRKARDIFEELGLAEDIAELESGERTRESRLSAERDREDG
jgi:class 3 adenylate cyclase/tetratricopeptide (TPR) repeat protein